ncbi:MAG: TRAP transporter small permease [Granulosicoccus sp.]
MSWIRAIHSVISGWAIAGGFLLLVVVCINVFSVLGSAVLGKPFPGDFEMTEVGVCVAVFCFLPYCQLTGSNVSADLFTAGASQRTLSVFAFFGSLVALLFSSVLVWRMYAGMLDQKKYEYTTAILQFPHWLAFVPILVSLALLVVASFMTLTGKGATSS